MTVEFDPDDYPPIPSLRSRSEGLPVSDGLAWARRAGGKKADEVLDERAAWRYWVDYVRFRTANEYDAVVVFTGDEGVGKSTGALRFALDVDRRFDVKNDLCYTAEQVFAAYERVRRGQPVDYDEGVRDLLAGETMKPAQVALVKALTLVREKGAVLLICIPSIWMLAKQIRARRATLWIHVTGRGHGVVHERDARVRYKPSQALGFAVSERAPKVTWDPFKPTSRIWRDYEERKGRELAAFLAEGRADLAGQREPADARKHRLDAARAKRYRARRRSRDPSGESKDAVK